MLPSFLDQIRISLASERLTLVRLRGGLRRRVAAKQIIECPAPAGDAPWRAALEALACALSQAEWQRAEARVVLSSGLVRYGLVPWSGALHSPQEQEALVRHSFAKVYGDRVTQWTMRWSTAGKGAPSMTCAVDKGLLDGLRALAKPARLRLQSVQPYLMAAFNQWRRQLKGQTAWFALAERDRLCLALLHHGQWQHIRSRSLAGGLDAQLPILLEQAHAMTELPASGNVYLHAPEHPAPRFPADSPWSLHTLAWPARRGLLPMQDGAYAMAMSGDH